MLAQGELLGRGCGFVMGQVEGQVMSAFAAFAATAAAFSAATATFASFASGLPGGGLGLVVGVAVLVALCVKVIFAAAAVAAATSADQWLAVSIVAVLASYFATDTCVSYASRSFDDVGDVGGR